MLLDFSRISFASMTTPVDRYLLEISRVYFAHIERGMSLEETVFAVQGEHKKVWG